MTNSQLLNDVWLDIAGHEIGAATSALLGSRRQHTKLLLYETDLANVDSRFWNRIGANLRLLELKYCSWSNHGLYSVLQQCSKLESLKLGSFTASINSLVLPYDACREELRASLRHLRHLHVDIYLTGDILDLLLGLMPNVTSVFFSWFDQESDFLERLPSILEKYQIIRTGGHFRTKEIGIEDITKFVEKTSGSLEDLKIDDIDDDDDDVELTESARDAIVNCIRLRRLVLRIFSVSLDASHLKKLFSNSPNLEILELPYLDEGGMVHLPELKKLHTLIPSQRSVATGITEESLCQFSEMSTLVELDLRHINVGHRGLSSLGCLKNLRNLALYGCNDSECLEAICKNFKKLRDLHLGWVSNLTDADGMKLCCFKELRSLRFYGGKGFTDLTFAKGVGSRAMKFLDIQDCPITDAGLMSIASHHGRLRKIRLGRCRNLTKTGIVALLQNESQLKELYVLECESLRPGMLADLRSLCPRLRLWNIPE